MLIAARCRSQIRPVTRQAAIESRTSTAAHACSTSGDPYHPKDVAHYVGTVHPLPYGEQPPNMANGVLVHDLSHNNLQDSNGLIYSVDSVGYGLDILMLTPPASLVGRTQRRCG
jgi:hypothetical protein